MTDKEKSLEDIFKEMQKGLGYQVAGEHNEGGMTSVTEQIVEIDANREPTAKVIQTTIEEEPSKESSDSN